MDEETRKYLESLDRDDLALMIRIARAAKTIAREVLSLFEGMDLRPGTREAIEKRMTAVAAKQIGAVVERAFQRAHAQDIAAEFRDFLRNVEKKDAEIRRPRDGGNGAGNGGGAKRD